MRRYLPIHQSLHRHAHVLGAERELVMTSALIALLVGIGGLTAVSIISGILFWIASVFVLRRMAKADPILSKVWLGISSSRSFTRQEQAAGVSLEALNAEPH